MLGFDLLSYLFAAYAGDRMLFYTCIYPKCAKQKKQESLCLPASGLSFADLPFICVGQLDIECISKLTVFVYVEYKAGLVLNKSLSPILEHILLVYCCF